MVTSLGGNFILAPSTVHAQIEELAGLDSVVSLTALETPTDDLIRLATAYADALKEFKTAQLNLETIQKLRPNAVVTNLEVQIAQLNLEAAQNKMKVIRAIVEKQLAAAQDKLEIIKYLETLGNGPAGAAAANADVPANGRNYVRAQDEMTIQILKMILAMR
jgi:multidrug resistance efflux pump